jgi:polyketide cyclase/dehydrase/lipid transport protein
MQDAVTEHVDAPPTAVWGLVADVTQTHRYSEETFEAEWLDGATEPAVGVRFRGHVKRNGRGPTYWTVCRITACEPGEEFGFEVLAGNRPVNTWHYRFDAAGGGTDVTESFRLPARPRPGSTGPSSGGPADAPTAPTCGRRCSASRPSSSPTRAERAHHE